jgi:hypothetical protein
MSRRAVRVAAAPAHAYHLSARRHLGTTPCEVPVRSSSVALLGLVLALGCDRTSPTAPAEIGPSYAKHEITHIDDRGGTFELRGLQGCFGELVIVTGTLRYKEHTMTSTETGNQDHTSFTFFEEGTAVGQTTGRVWTFKEKLQGKFNTPNLAAPHATFTRIATTHFIGNGRSLVVKLALHVVINGQGIGKVVVDTAKGPCEAI